MLGDLFYQVVDDYSSGSLSLTWEALLQEAEKRVQVAVRDAHVQAFHSGWEAAMDSVRFLADNNTDAGSALDGYLTEVSVDKGST